MHLQSEKVKPDIKILRQVKSICNRLPTMQTTQLNIESQTEFNDALLVAYLSSITKDSSAIGSLMQKFNQVYGSQGRSFMRYDE